MLSGREVVPLHLPAIPTRNCVCQEAHHEPGAGEGRSMKGTILVDMDNTLNDWDSQFTRLMKYLEPNFPFVEPEQRREYSIENNYPESLRAQILSLTSLRGFWSTMPVAPGAKQALSEMADSGLDVWIVSAPDPDLTGRCAMEKYEWPRQNARPWWVGFPPHNCAFRVDATCFPHERPLFLLTLRQPLDRRQANC
eukprot:Blabericola_migrator_1__6251@NODE_3152_length_2001_cov_47_706825_g1974_i0_p1_GENE_NODE_3152_length_2001_cov_47_706825_g1974_i0NODE_3152_length_2001_cov_47_706825_g1974_i0_p1_ORF_typecomplete_len195_score16_35NT5C/PF06941_12/1_9e13HAD/PF12710_7/0_0029Put_Phosphatase/PF06888_12/0_0048HAD_2/PF13419_6/0_018_NODE_3152_length_2001_cov_47_706825_g1974_i011841768